MTAPIKAKTLICFMNALFHPDNRAIVQAARGVAATLRGAGHEALFAGGCVRDALLGRQVKDIDIATAASPDQVEQLFPGATVAVGKSFGVVMVRRDGFSFDVASFRSDGAYTDGRHPDRIAFTSPAEDAKRRDFTVNGLFCDPESGHILDFVNGRKDLADNIIRAIGDPDARFGEDRLRMLRAVRFASTLEFTIEPETLAAIKRNACRIGTVSTERVAAELTRLICESPKPSLGLSLLCETGLLELLLPEADALRGTRQPPRFHPEGDVWTHTCLMLDALPAPRTPALAWSALLHDIGKPVTFCEETDPASGDTLIRFPCHAPVGSAMAGKVLERLKQPSALVAEVQAVVGDHMRFVEARNMRPAKLRRLLGASHFPTLLEVMRVDTEYSNGDFTTWDFIKKSLDAFRSEPVLPPPLVRGKDLIGWGYAPGPAMGNLLKDLYDAQLEGRFSSLEEARALLSRESLPKA
ncbi:MAG: HD domain-containing protein [Kiritimatiellae bacterium]|nr:HD domain-containing protein [Kiritimatiellia bacterium]